MSAFVTDIKDSINKFMESKQDDYLLECIIIKSLEILAMSYIANEEIYKYSDKNAIKNLIETLDLLITQDIKIKNYRLYYAAYGLKDILKTFINDELMEFLGFESLRESWDDLISYAISMEACSERIREWRDKIEC